MIVFTICKNGAKAGVLGASFSCALFGVRGSSSVNLGAQLFGRTLLNEGGQVFGFGFGFAVVRSGGRSVVGRSVSRAVLIEYDKAVRR